MLNKLVVVKYALDELDKCNLVIGETYKHDYFLDEYKVNANLGGIGSGATISEWYKSDELILLEDIIKDFYIKDITNISTKQRSLVFYKYKDYLQRGGIMSKRGHKEIWEIWADIQKITGTLSTRETGELLDIKPSQVLTYVYEAFPKKLWPSKEWRGYINGYGFTKVDCEMLFQAKKHKEINNLYYGQIKDIFESELEIQNIPQTQIENKKPIKKAKYTNDLHPIEKNSNSSKEQIIKDEDKKTIYIPTSLYSLVRVQATIYDLSISQYILNVLNDSVTDETRIAFDTR